MRNLKWIVVAAALMLGGGAQAQVSEERSVQGWVSEWARQNGKPLVWEAGPAYEGAVISWQAPIDASTDQGFARAFENLRAQTALLGLEFLVASIHPNAIVVRQAGQNVGARDGAQTKDSAPGGQESNQGEPRSR
jgi:hypothetical protein